MAAVFGIVGACAVGGDDDRSVLQAIKTTANLSMSAASPAVTLRSGDQWALTKTGSVVGTRVTWNIVALRTGYANNRLFVDARVTLSNTGSITATVGNLVVNLQTRSGKTWTSASVDIANGGFGDDATTTLIQPSASSEGQSSFTENTASGNIEFRNPNGGTLVPFGELSIGPGQTRTILVKASFDNTVLRLVADTQVRCELIVSTGNANTSKNSSSNIDINGNGVIDADEAHVRSLSVRFTAVVPAETNCTSAPVLTDTRTDIRTSGVRLGASTFDLEAATGTVVADVSGEGTVTNCAHLTSTACALNLRTCSTLAISSTPPCTHGTQGCPWATGDFKIYTQSSWEGTGKTTLESGYNTAFASTFGVLTIGDSTGFTASWTTVGDLERYIPQGGPPGILDANTVDTTSTSSGALGGELVALTLSVVFGDSGFTPTYGSVKFGDVRVCATATAADGMTVRQLLAYGNTLASSGTSTAINELGPVLAQLNASFDNGAVSAWAQEHIVNGACP